MTDEVISTNTWIGSVCSYFRDFLETDFKRSRTPKRAIISRNGKGQLTGISLLRYPRLYQKIWKELEEPLGPALSFEITVRRGNYKTRMSPNLFDVMKRHIDTISEEELNKVEGEAKQFARDCRGNSLNDPEGYSDKVLNYIKTNLIGTMASPLVNKINNIFENQGNDGYEKIYNLEEELGERLIQQISEPMSAAIANAIVVNDFGEVDKLIGDAYDPDSMREKFLDYFNNFLTHDFYEELIKLHSTLTLNENFQIYIYACTIKVGQSRYPLFYFPVDVSLSNSTFTIKADPHLFINKKAVDFASGEISRDIVHPVSVSLPERIFYLSEGETFLGAIQDTLDNLVVELSLNGSIDLADRMNQKTHQSQIAIDNSLHFAAFDKSDESLINDYEELLENLKGDSDTASDFISLIEKFMFSESKSFDDTIDKKWGELDLSERLVYESPIPLNEEQRKIILGLNQEGCRYIAVEGPPGTGKSHTITACVFDAILQGKNVLILSDKKEALDVAENKISHTLKTVRRDPNIQDPILRLGKHGSTYAKILSTDTITRLKENHRVACENSLERDDKINQKENLMKSAIGQVKEKTEEIDIQKIADAQRNEREFGEILKDAEDAFRNPAFVQGVLAVKQILDFVEQGDIRVLFNRFDKSITLDNLEYLFEVQRRINAGEGKVTITEEMRFFKDFSVDRLPRLGEIISKYQACKYPVFGFLFSKRRAREIDRMLGSEFECISAINAHTQIEKLEKAEEGFGAARSDLKLAEIEKAEEINLALFQYMRNIRIEPESIEPIQKAIEAYRCSMQTDKRGYLNKLGIRKSNLAALASNSTSPERVRLEKLAVHAEQISEITAAFKSVPEMDYAKELVDFQEFHALRLANILDGRVVKFATRRKNVATQIKMIIRKKQKFPKSLFENLKKAFPVIISGIRDYAEYVPLEKDIFDLVIIDEASQVSIAQALPAFVRAKKVLVLGDKNQFSNVKTTNASKTTNQNYKNRVLNEFRGGKSRNQAALNQVEVFDIKTSVLEFVDRIANLKIMLRKHFRSYPALISYSSKYFYGGSLQTVKIRGKIIDEVIQFLPVCNELLEIKRNINHPEAEAIVAELEKLLELEDPPDVCVITPHNEQQRYIFQMVQEKPNSATMMEKLKLRVFTFDTCQGEEAHTVLYSMVATRTRDRLNYIFPKNMENAGDVEDVLRLQRLNVGFSRAKERICFFHSKPIKEFSGSIGAALSHFKETLRFGQNSPRPDSTDPTSPMESKVLHWLEEVPLFQELREDRKDVEIDAQFEIGQYLRQLDPTYNHPAYKVDFLIKVRDTNKELKIIIEYDGFKEHFENLDRVDASNYIYYMKASDVERQKILEGYGYKFLRINRFNIGADPVKTLDERLRRIVENVNMERKKPKLIKKHHEQQQSLENGESKVCAGECGRVKPLAKFYDSSLKTKYGRICLKCKRKSGVKARV